MRGSGGRGGGGAGRGGGGYSNPCLTMHQPWASLLVHGIKRVEGRSWPAPLTGRIWIHAAGKVPEPETIRQMEAFYREIYAVNGVTDIRFPEHYPVSRLLGCVEVVGCVRGEELAGWDAVPESLRLEALTDFCWLCEHPQKLLIPFEMRGYQRVYNLEKRIFEAAVRGLCPMEGPQPVKFSLPDPRDPFSLKPGSLNSFSNSNASLLEKATNVSEAIAGARAAATQYTRKDQSRSISNSQIEIRKHDSAGTSEEIDPKEERRMPSSTDGHLFGKYQASYLEKAPSASEAIAGSRAAATPYGGKNQSRSTSNSQFEVHMHDSAGISEEITPKKEIRTPSWADGSLSGKSLSLSVNTQSCATSGENNRAHSQDFGTSRGERLHGDYRSSNVKEYSFAASGETNVSHSRDVGTLQRGTPSHKENEAITSSGASLTRASTDKSSCSLYCCSG